tara:strand:- start:735 stop:1907 length:1173 start_codon:yes stop_codon:yes gene_type:complete
MADIEALNGVAAADIEAFNGVAKADIQAVNGLTVPASGATLWTIVGADGAVATAAHSDLNDWTGVVSAGLSPHKDHLAVGYGKDGSGSPLWVSVSEDGTREIRYTSDPTAGVDAWTDVNPSNPGRMHAVLWGNNVWMAAGDDGNLWRSTNGTSWSEVDMSGVTNWATDVDVRHLASDGAGKWMCGNDQYIFVSTNDGAGWTELYDCADAPLSSASYEVRGITHTVASGTARWAVLVKKASPNETNVIHAPASDTSSWTKATYDGGVASGQDIVGIGTRHMVAGAGIVMMVGGDNVSRSADGGQDWIKYVSDGDELTRTDARGLGTDGNGTWVVVHDSGRVSISTNHGVAGSWAEQTGVQDGGSNTNLRFPTGGSNVENLDAVAANVLLPV